jgi:osmoprotectant transport system permease protein
MQESLSLLVSKWSFFQELLIQHIEISLIAIVVAIVVGGISGVLISEYQKAAKPTLSVINFLYTIPSISMLGFLIPFSGIGNATAIIALIIYALLPMVRSSYTGITSVDLAIIEAAKGMGSTRGQILRKVQIPLAMPVIMSGIRSMATMTIALAGIASFIGSVLRLNYNDCLEDVTLLSHFPAFLS